MIFDFITNSTAFRLPQIFYAAVEHSLTLTVDSPNGITELGNGLRASINSYTTKTLAEAKPETHRKYIDMQIIIAGIERIHCFEYGIAPISQPYDPSRDIEFYDASGYVPDVSLTLRPGIFAIFFPWDVHMTMVAIGEAAPVKKVVYKIPIEIING